MPVKIILHILLLMALLPIPVFSASKANPKHTAASPMNSTDSANALFEEILKKYASDSSQKGLYECAEAYIKLCDIYYRCGYYTNAFSAASNALKIAENNGFENLLPSIYNYMGTIYCTWHDFYLGTEYLKKGLEYISPVKNPGLYRSLIINIQGAYINMGNAALAKPYYDKMRNLTRPDSVVDYFITLNKGLFLVEGKNFGKAIPYFRAAEALALKHNLGPAMLSSTYDYTGDCMKGLNCDSATFYWAKAVNTPGIPAYLRLSILKKLCDSFKELKQREKAVYYGNQYIMLSDSIFEVNDINRMKDIQMAYENEKKLKMINQLDADKKARDLKLSSQRKFLIAALCVIGLFILMSVGLYRQKHRLQQAYLDLFSRNKEAMDIQNQSHIRENEFRKKIAILEETLTSTANSLPAKSNEGKTQSVEKLSEEKRNDILLAIEEVLGKTDVICNPDFSIDMLSELTGYNSRYVSHILNDIYGCNFRTLLNKKRMDIARQRIMDVKNYGNLTIQAIAESVGYRSHSGFVQLFRKHTGVTPSMFQKMAKEQTQNTSV